MSDDIFNYFQLPEQGHALMREYVSLMDGLEAFAENLRDNYNAQIKAEQVRVREKQKELWYRMAAMAGVDADKSWNKPNWHVEDRYIDAGFAALVTHKLQQDPLAAMLGAPEPEEENHDKVPEGETIN